jgi:hypothetical protein
MSKKMEEVKEANVRVVSEDFLQDVSASTKSLQDLFSTHILSPWGAEVKAEPVEAVAPKGKSGTALPKKSKGPTKEEGETQEVPVPGSSLLGPLCLCPRNVRRGLPRGLLSTWFPVGPEQQRALQGGRKQCKGAGLADGTSEPYLSIHPLMF